MEVEKTHTCCIIGHRIMNETEELKKRISDAIENLIVEEKVNTFLFRGKGKFDNLCFYIASGLKQKYPDIQRIKAGIGFAIFRNDFCEFNMEPYYDDVYGPGRILNNGETIYMGKKEEERIDMSSYCIAYYDENHDFPDELLCGTEECTTGALMEYAKGKDVNIINIAE